MSKDMYMYLRMIYKNMLLETIPFNQVFFISAEEFFEQLIF